MGKSERRLLTVSVRKRDGVVFAGTARSVSSTNGVGNFDILPMHTNFVAVIKDRLEVVDEAGQAVKMSISRGIIHVRQDMVEVYLGI